METMRMKYSRYKQHYADCKTVPGTYDKELKTIMVEIPDGRMKASGVRGERFHTYEFHARDKDGKVWRFAYRAICISNAMKQHKKTCAYCGYEALSEEEEVMQ